MRQAGRYLPEYRELRRRTSTFVDFCLQPELTVEASLQPLSRFPLDGAIVFSDILLILQALGSSLSYEGDTGPKLSPISLHEEVTYDPSRVEKVFSCLSKSLRILRGELPPHTTLIGFSGAPWTLACYALEGGAQEGFPKALQAARVHPRKFGRLIGLLVDMVVEHLSLQARAGAEVLQIFDTWAGLLSKKEAELWCLRPSGEIFRRFRRHFPDIPVIFFPRGATSLYPEYARLGRRVALSLSSADSLREVRRILPEGTVLQGNLCPKVLVSGGEALQRETHRILREGEGSPHIFNLGHGVLPSTPVAHVKRLTNLVHTHSSG